MSSGQAEQGSIWSTGVQNIQSSASAQSLESAQALASRSERRVDTPVRKSFVRNDDPTTTPPLAQLVARGGRGGAVPVKLFLALLWMSSAKPYTTEVRANGWASLLDLEGPLPNRARRISKSLQLLQELNLVSLERRPGRASEVTILNESGSGEPYEIPSDAWTRAHLASNKSEEKKNVYLKVPSALWLNGRIQPMSSAALAMLLVLLGEQSAKSSNGTDVAQEVWWSTDAFPDRYGISSSMRARGTKELVERELIVVQRRFITPPGSRNSMSADRVRNVYRLINDAVLPRPKASPVRNPDSTSGQPQRRLRPRRK